MHWLRTTYLTWSKTQGLEITKDDLRFIEKTLYKLPEKAHKSIMKRYCEKWLEGIGETTMSSQNQNKGRFMANSWLRRTLELKENENDWF